MFFLAAACLVVCVAETGFTGDAVDRVVLDVGGDESNMELGWGWSYPERGEGTAYRWMKHLEADLDITVHTAETCRVIIRAMPLYLTDRIQTMGLYLNGAFQDEWQCTTNAVFHSYTTTVHAAHVIAGTNRLTLRAGYRYKLPQEHRTLSLAIDHIVIAPVKR